VGLFSVELGREGYDKSSVLLLEQLPVRSGRQTLRLVVDQAPKFAGVDPFNKWVDRNSDDNLKEVTGT
jgi:hypothetical protein